MLGLKTLNRAELTTLRFADAENFRAAARRAASAKIPVDAPGDRTLVIRSADIAHFRGLAFTETPIADKVSDSERAFLRRRIR